MQASRIAESVDKYLKGTDNFLVDVLIKPGNRVYVFLDGDHGVTIDDCVRVSKLLERELQPEIGDYELIVSSAGADQPLSMPRQYIKNIGRSLHVKLSEDREVKGRLLEIDESGIRLLAEGDKKKKAAPAEIYLKFTEIKESKVIISFK